MENNNPGPENILPSDVIKEALNYTSLGFSVMPLGTIIKDVSGKKIIQYPATGWKRYQTEIASREEVSSWNCKNLGIVTGKISGLFVLDTDLYKKTFDHELLKSFNLPITPVQETASGGRQYFFRLPDGMFIKNDVCIGTEDSGIDIRGDGGMVIVPPSKTPYGEYRWLVSPTDEPLADIPPKLLELVASWPGDELKTKKTLTELVGLREGGGRNNALASFIGKLLITMPSDDWDKEVLPMAQEVNRTYTPPLEDDELLSIYRSITKIENGKRIKLNTSNGTETAQFNPSLTHADLITKEFPPARYTIEPFFEQGTMNMLSAPPNTWKSWLLFLFAGSIVSGSSVFDKFKVGKANVMIVNEEDSPRLIQDRLKHLNIVDTSLSIYYRIAQGAKLKKDFVDDLIKEAKEKSIGVIMFDSLRSIHEADENDSTAMQGVMDLLKKIARENITVIFTHHHRKKAMFAKNDDSESSRGSSAINAAISGHISLEEVNNKEGEKYLILKHLKSKVGEKLQPFDVGVQTGDIISFQYLGEHKPKEQALTEAKTKILNELQGREDLMGRKDFVFLKIGGMTTIKEALKALEKDEKIKVILRKEAERSGKKTFSPGKANEKLYTLAKEDDNDVDLNMFDGIQQEDIWSSQSQVT